MFGNDVRFDMVTVYGTNITFYDPRDMDDNKLYYVLDDEGRVIKEFVDTCTLDQPDSNTTIYFRRSIEGGSGGGGETYAPPQPPQTPPPNPTCSNDPTLCSSEDECISAGWYWYDGECHLLIKEQATCESDPSMCETEEECTSAGWAWYGGKCHMLQGTTEYLSIYPKELRFVLYPDKICDEKNVTIFWFGSKSEFMKTWVSPDVSKYVKYPTLGTEFTISPELPKKISIKVCGIEDEFNYIYNVSVHRGSMSFFIEREKFRIQDIFSLVIRLFHETPPKCYEDPSYCTTENDCKSAGWYWYDGECHEEPKPEIAPTPAPEKPEKEIPITYIIIGIIIFSIALYVWKSK